MKKLKKMSRWIQHHWHEIVQFSDSSEEALLDPSSEMRHQTDIYREQILPERKICSSLFTKKDAYKFGGTIRPEICGSFQFKGPAGRIADLIRSAGG